MSNSYSKPQLDIFLSYMTMIKNSRGANLFRNLFYRIDNSVTDVLEDGDLSCAVFVTTILYLFKLIKERHTTVKSTIEDLVASGWKEVKDPREGAVILWGFKKKDEGTQGKHQHIGFYINANTAISNSSDERVPIQHHITYGEFPDSTPRREILAYYWHPALDH